MPTQLIPLSFVEVLAGAVTVLAIFFVLLSLFPRIQSHAVRLLALLFVVGLALIANHPSTYFAAIFVVATAVTELEFLQNLAAIIRGNKEYFQYKLETLSREQIERKVKAEQEKLAAGEAIAETIVQQTESPNTEGVNGNHKDMPEDRAGKPSEREEVKMERPGTVDAPSERSNVSILREDIQRIVSMEQRALMKLEWHLARPITRNVRIKIGATAFEFDGIVTPVNSAEPDLLVEVKYVGALRRLLGLTHSFSQLEQKVRDYSIARGKPAKLHLVLILNNELINQEDYLASVKHRIARSSIDCSFSIFASEDLESPVTFHD
ncbi:MAG TPA: hypothetical protein VEC35_08695 [Noviherbaspirillum sp.]|nr:hypothetical protein [Noviherbaspirillum sp.]